MSDELKKSCYLLEITELPGCKSQGPHQCGFLRMFLTDIFFPRRKRALKFFIMFYVLIFTGFSCYILFFDATVTFERVLPLIFGHCRIWEQGEIRGAFLEFGGGTLALLKIQKLFPYWLSPSKILAVLVLWVWWLHYFLKYYRVFCKECHRNRQENWEKFIFTLITHNDLVNQSAHCLKHWFQTTSGV